MSLVGVTMSAPFLAVPKRNFLTHYLKIPHLSLRTQTWHIPWNFANTNSFIHLHDNSQVTINEDAWMRLITAIYFSKHKVFFKNKTIEQTYTSLVKFPDCKESQCLFLSWTGYPSTHRIVTLKDWHEFIRKVTFHASKDTCHHKAKVLPSQWFV